MKKTRRSVSPALLHVSSLLVCLLLVALPALVMMGCSNGGAKTLTPLIAVALGQAPPASMLAGTSAVVSAGVSDDPAEAGIDWVAVCGKNNNRPCGSFSSAHTANGGSTTFTAPADVPVGSTVAVTAFSATDHSKSVAAMVTITSKVTGITFTLAPPALMPAGGLVNVAASVTGDTANAGVDWTASCNNALLLCPSSSGFFTAQHTDNGAPTTFNAPSIITVPGIVGAFVTITATSTADPNFSITFLVKVGSPISLTVTQAPPQAMLTGAMANLSAVVNNDITNAGVDWQVQCQNAPCGSFSPGGLSVAHTASGTPITFIAPAAVPAGSNIVTIIAASTADPSQTAQFMVAISAPISVQITQGVTNNTIVVNAQAQLIAVVSNDTSANPSVNWTATCGSADCGSFTPPQTSSGATTTYKAPAAVPAGGTVTITATSATDKTRSAGTGPITITASVPPDSLVNGNFVFLLTGVDINNSSYSLAGTIIGDGNGNILAGSEADGADSSNQGSTPLTGSYSLGKDGRGQITLNLLDTNNFATFGVNNGVNGVITLSMAFVTSKHAVLSESDGFGTGTGTLDFQDPTALAAFQNPTAANGAGFNGTYSVSLFGTEVASPNNKFFLASALSTQFAAATGTVTELTAVADQSDNGTVTVDGQATTGVNALLQGTTADAAGRLLGQGTIDLGISANQLSLIAYLIDANHFVLTDFRDPAFGTFIFGGYMTLQPAAPTISGTYAFTETGQTPGLSFQVAGGIFACGGAGVIDVAPLGAASTTNHAISTACTTPASGRGTITVTGAAAAGISQFAAYPTIDNGLQIIEIDSAGSTGAGVALQQTVANPIPASDLKGKYASDFLATSTTGFEAFVGQIGSDGVSKLSGTVDAGSFAVGATLNPPGPDTATPSIGAGLSGSFSASNNGRFALATSATPLTLTPAAGQPSPQIVKVNSAVCYIVDAQTCLLLGLDTTAPAAGILELQNLPL